MVLVFVIHLTTTVFMTGLIWMVQIVHYPLFKNIGSNEFLQYEKQHSKLITFIVGPVMTIELVTGILLATSNYLNEQNFILYLISFGLLILIWLCTIFIQIPQHKKLSSGYDKEVIDKLVSYNWIRTVSWSARALILCYILSDIIT